MDVSNNVKKFAVAVGLAAGVAGMTGCSTTNTIYGANSGVSNRPENTGPKQYGSEACRAAKVEVVDERSYYQNRGYYRTQYSVFDRVFGRDQAFKNAYTVSDSSGQRYVLVSSMQEQQMFQLAGIGAGVAAAAGGDRPRYGDVKQAGKVLLGAAVGGFLGGMADDMVNGKARAAFDRCRLDVAEGAYKLPNQGNYPVPSAGYQRNGFDSQFSGGRPLYYAPYGR